MIAQRYICTYFYTSTYPKVCIMTAVKERSTRNHNKGVAISACPVTYVMNKIGSHWKPIIIFQLMSGPKRYSELRRAIPEVTEKMLIQHLKQLQADNLINRKAEAVVPPVVTYSLTQSGLLLTPILDSMVAWALEEMAG